MSQPHSSQKISPSRPPGHYHYCDLPSHAALDSPDTHRVAHRVRQRVFLCENIALASDDNIDQAARRPSILHCILGYEVPV